MEYKITISETDENYLLYDLLDIQDWIEKAVLGRINYSKTKMKNNWRPILLADPSITVIPITDESFLALVMARPDYKNREQREAEKIQ